MPIGPDYAALVPGSRNPVEASAKPSPSVTQDVSPVSVVRAAPLPSPALPSGAPSSGIPSSGVSTSGASFPAANDRLQPTRAAVVGLRESRAMAALAADLVARLADGAEVDTLRTRLREVVEIGSARDTDGPLAALYAAARRDSTLALARLFSIDPVSNRRGFSKALVEAGQELRELDERFAVRDFALTGPPPGTAPSGAPAPGLDLLV